MGKNIIIALLATTVIWFGTVIIRIENQRYALFVGMCRDPVTHLTDAPCLLKVQTRTPKWSHLFHALAD